MKFKDCLIKNSFSESYIPVTKSTNRVNDPKSASAHEKLTKDIVKLVGPDRKIYNDTTREESWHSNKFPAKTREEHQKIRDHAESKGWKQTAKWRTHDHDSSVGSVQHTSPDGKHQITTKFNLRPERSDEEHGHVFFATKKYK